MIRHCRKKINKLENGAVATLQNEWNAQSKVLKMKRASERYGTTSFSVIHGSWGSLKERSRMGWNKSIWKNNGRKFSKFIENCKYTDPIAQQILSTRNMMKTTKAVLKKKILNITG